MSNIVSYMLTDINNKRYIGITLEFKRRLAAHKKTERFKDGIIKYEILKEYETYEEAELDEPLLIEKYDTFNNGLNLSINGKGNHLSGNFTTRNYKFTDSQRQNMKDSHWSKNPEIIPYWLEKTHTDETKQKISKNRKGIVSEKHCKLSLDTRLQMHNDYNENNIQFSTDFIKLYTKKTQQHLVHDSKITDLISKNGKPLTLLVLYKHHFAQKYNISAKQASNICMGKFIKDKNAYERT